MANCRCECAWCHSHGGYHCGVCFALPAWDQSQRRAKTRIGRCLERESVRNWPMAHLNDPHRKMLYAIKVYLQSAPALGLCLRQGPASGRFRPLARSTLSNAARQRSHGPRFGHRSQQIHVVAKGSPTWVPFLFPGRVSAVASPEQNKNGRQLGYIHDAKAMPRPGSGRITRGLLPYPRTKGTDSRPTMWAAGYKKSLWLPIKATGPRPRTSIT